MPRYFSLGCILSIFFSFLISGCSKPILKTPENLPPIVKEYKNVVLHVAVKRMQKTGVYLTKGELFSILTRDILLRSSLIGMIGKDDFGFYVSDINDAYKPGDLFLGFTDRKDSSSVVDIFVWKEADEGYWLPINAEKGNMINWISNSSITATLRAIKAKHVVIVADSCYSGKLARGIHTVDRTAGYISRLSQKKARCVISSGGLEPVIDSGGKSGHSVFASALLDALKKNNTIN